ncbi:hypothetical protein HDF19_00080 [Mucilaginibacter sp. E4BP6]|uniref:hypothetical protein n=1 Tax=Mucilaginibacter sp. E4BP6 TaxID=2723089 RepID=UPI0015C6A830|nr:hypothetical protein [Mucilaginibacter sp. E4BP6]NYE67995.1 hypothetical protein [Mucilaginibacter sp. E4BP6]
MTRKICTNCSRRIRSNAGNRKAGYGGGVPPLRSHVIIYFAEKEASQNAALAFFEYFEKRRWRNKHGNKLKNWKTAAWEWAFQFKGQ